MAGVPCSPAREQEASYVIFKKWSYGRREGAKGIRPQLEGLKAVLPKQLLLFYFESRIPARLGTPHTHENGGDRRHTLVCSLCYGSPELRVQHWQPPAQGVVGFALPQHILGWSKQFSLILLYD